LLKGSKLNEIKYFDRSFPKVKARYLKVLGHDIDTPPSWYNAARQTSLIFADEVLIIVLLWKEENLLKTEQRLHH
jgi:hypothetical protein